MENVICSCLPAEAYGQMEGTGPHYVQQVKENENEISMNGCRSLENAVAEMETEKDDDEDPICPASINTKTGC